MQGGRVISIPGTSKQEFKVLDEGKARLKTALQLQACPRGGSLGGRHGGGGSNPCALEING